MTYRGGDSLVSQYDIAKQKFHVSKSSGYSLGFLFTVCVCVSLLSISACFKQFRYGLLLEDSGSINAEVENRKFTPIKNRGSDLNRLQYVQSHELRHTSGSKLAVFRY